MRILGIDFGTKRVGLALTDKDGKMAFPHAVYPNDASFVQMLIMLIEKEGVDEVVIGHSLNTDGKENIVQEKINELMTEITLQSGIPVHLEPEQYSTQEALRIQGKTDMTDASAAAIILNSYLSKR